MSHSSERRLKSVAILISVSLCHVICFSCCSGCTRAKRRHRHSKFWRHRGRKRRHWRFSDTKGFYGKSPSFYWLHVYKWPPVCIVLVHCSLPCISFCESCVIKIVLVFQFWHWKLILSEPCRETLVSHVPQRQRIFRVTLCLVFCIVCLHLLFLCFERMYVLASAVHILKKPTFFRVHDLTDFIYRDIWKILRNKCSYFLINAENVEHVISAENVEPWNWHFVLCAAILRLLFLISLESSNVKYLPMTVHRSSLFVFSTYFFGCHF